MPDFSRDNECMTDQTDNDKKQTSEQPNTEQVRAKPKKRLVHRVLCLISAVIFLPVLLLIAILSTETGTRIAIQSVDKLIDGLSIGEVSGNLQQGLVVADVQFHGAGVDTKIQQAKLQLDFGCLLQRKICVEELSIHQPKIHIDTASLPPSEPREERDYTPIQRITLPVSVEVKKATVEDLALGIDHHQMQLATFQTAASLDNQNGLILSPTQINDFSFVMLGSEEDNAPPVAAKQTSSQPVDWAKVEQVLTPPLLAALTDITLPFDMHVQDIQAQNWQYQYVVNDKNVQDIRVDRLQLQANAIGPAVNLQKLEIESSLGNVQAQGGLQLQQDFPLNLNLQAELQAFNWKEQPIVPQTQLDLNLSGALKKQTVLSLKTQGELTAELSGQVELNREKTPLQLRLTTPSFTYPFNPEDKTKGDKKVAQAQQSLEPLHIQDAELNVSGNLLDYQVALSGQTKGIGIPPSKVKLTGSGGLSYADIQALQLNALDGSLNLTGKLDWKSGFQWQSEAEFNQLNAGAYIKNWAAVLSGKLASTGQVDSQGWAVHIPTVDINGTLEKRALKLKGQLSTDSHTLLDIGQLQLNYGENQIVAKGKISEQSDFNLAINAPDLRGLLPDLAASVVGNVHLGGNISKPDVNVELTGNNIRFQDLRLNKLYAKGKVNVAEQIQGRVDLELTEFGYGEIKVSRADLWLTGREENHQLHFRAKGDPLAAVFNVYGNFDRNTQRWQGVLNQIELKSPLGSLVNDKNINATYDNKLVQATVSEHCWRNPELDICFPQTFKAGANGEIPFDIKRLNLELVNKLIEQNGLLKGQLRSQGKVAWFTDKPLQFSLQVDGNNIGLAHKIDYRTFKLEIPQLSVDGHLENNNLSVKSDIQLERQGRINTDLKLQDIAKARKLGGNLNIQQLNLSLLKQLLSSGENISGEVAANLSFAGDLNNPLLNGMFNINQIKAKMKSLPFELTDGNVSLNFYGNRSTLAGTMQTSDSRLELDGDAAWQNLNRWDSRVHVKTEQFNVDIPSMAKLKVSADVTAKATPELLQLSGDVAIPWARITVESLPESAVSVSADEVILDGKTDKKPTALPTKMAAKTKSGMAIESNLNIRIGDDVKVSAYGLDSDLRGLLAVKQEKGNLGLFGQIALKNGRYASFGQDLLIRKGEISFSGLPSQPMLNIEAIRNPEAMEDSKVTAGIKVIGLADSPEVEVFSEPSMPQDQALSYILTGRSLENSGEAGSSGSVGAALLGLGLGKSGKLVGGIGETFGIQDLNLGTAGVGDSSKVVVSGNITPRLQVKYGVGLFDGLAEVTLRYKLMSQLYLQSVSGVNQAFDILYQFDF